MKIEELIKKTGDKLISQKDKLAYYMAVKKLEVIAKIPNKEQRSEAMGKFKDVLAKKVTPVVMAALTAISPVVLAGCDETKTPSDIQVAYVTDTNGEYVTDSNGEPLTTEITTPTTDGEIETEIETERELTEVETLPLTEEMLQNLKTYFAEFSLEDALNGKYTKAYNEIKKEVEALDSSNSKPSFIRYIDVDVKAIYSKFDEILGGDDTYSLDINIPRDTSGAKYQYYRDGAKTAVFIITTKDEEGNEHYYYNGVVDNEIYTDGLEYLYDLPFAITEESKEVIQQLNSNELGKILGDEFLCFLIQVDRKDEKDDNNVCAYVHGVEHLYDKFREENGRQSGEYSYNIIDYRKQACERNVAFGVGTMKFTDVGPDGSSNSGQTTYTLMNVFLTVFENWGFDAGYYILPDGKTQSFYSAEPKFYEPRCVASADFNFSPENIKLPTQESEAEK